MKLDTAVNVGLLVCALFIVGLVGHREFSSRPIPELPSIQLRAIDTATWDEVASGGHLLYGSANAPVKVVEFGDFQCGTCATASEEMRALHERNPGLVAVIYRHYPLQAIHDYAYIAAVASECAADQSAFHGYYEALFEHQEDLAEMPWTKLATLAQVRDTATFLACLDSPSSHGRVARDTLVAYHLGIRSTPTFVVNGNVLLRNLMAEQWDRLVQDFARDAPAVGSADR